VAVRVEQGDHDALRESIAAGSTSSGVLVYDDGETMPPWIDRPWAGREQFITSEAMRLAAVPADEIRKIRPVVPQQLFPQTKGYDRTPLTIEETLSADRWSPTVRSWISGPSRQVRRADMQEDLWSGTMRNVSSTSNPMM
jgi:hypothetical protein